ncbi:amino acid adenylation domain-containing protein [Thiospirochaeta perfilievii]|uniref:Amino acid adenylation domain-containing protein n=1 Tax=Thiospirochaeta perfilievii TaxID=252967 RepID=A0A5C1QC82_9SPIO|nr:non-ribosomal peptide synthetase [Thiospirochaeta perfilievii]QEN04710.1 amino acid adenylation domain-containing protein [Thiospirochaeta perfilievii]
MSETIEYHLSEPQKMILWGELLYPNSSLNTLCATYKLAEQNNITILKSVILDVLNENPGLHLQICNKKASATQYINRDMNYEIEVLEFLDKEDELLWIRSKATHHFELFNSRLYEFYIYISYDKSVNLLIMSHHIISDAWSFQSLATQIYEKYTKGFNKCDVPSNSRYSYLEYLKTEEQFLSSKRMESCREFWRKKFHDIEELPLLKDINRKNSRDKSLRFKLSLSEELQEKIRKGCNKYNISFPTFFLTCLVITLKVIKPNDERYLLGTLTYNRLGKQEKETIGMFVNTVPMIFRNRVNQSFLDLKTEVDKELMGIMRNQRYPLSYIVNDVELKKLDIPNHLQIIYSYQNVVLPYDYTYQYNNSSSYPILFRPTREGLDGAFHVDIDYQVESFSENEIKKISQVYESVINNLDIDSSEDEMDTIINGYNKSIEQTLHRVFEKKAAKYAEDRAVSFRDRSLTYYELNKKANHLGIELMKRGAGNETPIILILNRSLEMMISILAVLKTGSCYLPLSTEHPISRTKKIIELSGASIILHNMNRFEDYPSTIYNIDVRDIVYPQADVPNLNIDVKPNNLAYILYTSGSTGEPKGVMIEHRSVINRLLWMQNSYPIGKDDRLLQKTPYTFDVSVWELFWWYFNNSSVHFLVPSGEKEPEAIVNDIRDNSITTIHFVPSMLSLFLEHVIRGNLYNDIKTLKRVICSGEALSLHNVKEFYKYITANNGTTLHNLYGPTEATVDVTSYNCSGDEKEFIPIGKGIDNVDLYILDKSGKVLPKGVVGELFIGGVCLARGYFNRSELTEEKFKYNQYVGKRLYNTGDLAEFLEDGNIKYHGRVDHQVKIRGNRVELGEIESLILKYDGVSEVAVIAPKDERGNAYLGAYFVALNRLSHEKIRHYIQKELPTYMVPSYFVQMDKFPLTSSGKLDRKSLPKPNRIVSANSRYHAPVNDREEEICEIWEDVLKLENISRDDNFFEIGGDSLSMIQVLFPLKEKYDISLQDLFEFPTIETLSLHIHSRDIKKIEFNEKAYSSIVKRWESSKKIRDYTLSLRDVVNVKEVNIDSVLITGATGFIGAYIVKEYLENCSSILYLLIRGKNLGEAQGRFLKKMNFYFGPEFIIKYKSRIIVVLGDIRDKNLGMDDKVYQKLSQSIESVIHGAANVHHYGDREEIYRVNVNGTRNILKFCTSGSLKKIFFISTISIGLNSVNETWGIHFTEDEISDTDDMGNVYLDSKIKAEAEVREILPLIGGQILRLGNVVNDSNNGVFQENREENAFYNLMFEFKKRRVIPDIEVPFMDLSFVNETAQAIRLLTTCSLNGTYHIFNPNRVSLQDIFVDQNITIVDLEEFVSSLSYGDSILTHGYYLENIHMLNIVTYNDRTEFLLSILGFQWSPPDRNKISFLWEEALKSYLVKSEN